MPKEQRSLQSHEIAKQVRQRLVPVANVYGARIQVAEVPPGPPVLQTLVAEVYGPSQQERIAIARRIRDLWKRTDGVVDVDWYVEDDQPKFRILVDKEKAALNGISEDDIARTMQVASAGYEAGLLHVDSEKEDVPLNVRLRPRQPLRSGTNRRPEGGRPRRQAGGAARIGAGRAGGCG